MPSISLRPFVPLLHRTVGFHCECCSLGEIIVGLEQQLRAAVLALKGAQIPAPLPYNVAQHLGGSWRGCGCSRGPFPARLLLVAAWSQRCARAWAIHNKDWCHLPLPTEAVCLLWHIFVTELFARNGRYITKPGSAGYIVFS